MTARNTVRGSALISCLLRHRKAIPGEAGEGGTGTYETGAGGVGEGGRTEHGGPRLWKVMVVEDNPRMLACLREELGRSYNVLAFDSAEVAFEKVVEFAPDIIVVGAMRRGMGGLEMCRRIKNDHRRRHIPVILIAARATEEQQIEGFEAGVDGYIFKPFSVRLLLSRIDNIIRQRENVRDALARSTVDLAQLDIASPDKTFMDKLMAIIEKDISNPDLSIEDVCNEMAMSHVSLHRRLKSIAGSNVNGFIREVRLKKAAQMLSVKGIGITEVLYAVGFNHKSYFTNCFKERFGMTPSEYAKKHAK